MQLFKTLKENTRVLKTPVYSINLGKKWLFECLFSGHLKYRASKVVIFDFKRDTEPIKLLFCLRINIALIRLTADSRPSLGVFCVELAEDFYL